MSRWTKRLQDLLLTPITQPFGWWAKVMGPVGWVIAGLIAVVLAFALLNPLLVGLLWIGLGG